MKIEKKEDKLSHILTVRLLWTLLLISVTVLNTEMIRFSARGAYLLLVPKRSALIYSWYLRGGRSFTLGTSEERAYLLLASQRRALIYTWYLRGGRLFTLRISEEGAFLPLVYISEEGAYLLLIPQRWALIPDGALFLFWETTECSKQNFITLFIKTTGTITETVTNIR